MESWIADLRYGSRMLLKTPGLTLIAAIALAVGIGANVTIFGFVNTLVLRPVDAADPERLVRVHNDTEEIMSFLRYGDYLEYRDRNQSMSVARGVLSRLDDECPHRRPPPDACGDTGDGQLLRDSGGPCRDGSQARARRRPSGRRARGGAQPCRLAAPLRFRSRRHRPDGRHRPPALYRGRGSARVVPGQRLSQRSPALCDFPLPSSERRDPGLSHRAFAPGGVCAIRARRSIPHCPAAQRRATNPKGGAGPFRHRGFSPVRRDHGEGRCPVHGSRSSGFVDRLRQYCGVAAGSGAGSPT